MQTKQKENGNIKLFQNNRHILAYLCETGSILASQFIPNSILVNQKYSGTGQDQTGNIAQQFWNKTREETQNTIRFVNLCYRTKY